MDSAARATPTFERDDERRTQRYLELLGIAADVFLRERDFDVALRRVLALMLESGTEWVAIYRPSRDDGFEAVAVLHADPARAASAFESVRDAGSASERYLTFVAATREVLAVNDVASDENTTTFNHARLLVPIATSDVLWGVLQFHNDPQAGAFDRMDIEFARDLSKLVAIAFDNAELVERARAAFDELRFLGDVGEKMVESLDLGTRLDRFLGAVVPRLADWATVNLLEDDGTIETLAIAHRDPAKAHIIERLRGPYYGNIETNQGTPNALRTGKSRYMTGVDEAFLRHHIRPEMFEDVIALGADSAFTVPLIAHGRIYGTLAAMRTQRERPFTEREIFLIEELARRAAVAIANAKLFERSSTVADAFQEVQLPEKLPRVPGIAFSAYYAAGRRESTIGGDWYDAFPIPGGRLVISIGDVAGSGLRAAVLMGSVRQLIRGAAQLAVDPSAILDAVDRALKIEYPEAIVTAFVGVIDPKERAITYASAGHPPPLLRSKSGDVCELATVGLPLGLRGSGESRTTVVPVEAGSLLLLYTDGLTESTRDILEGERRVHSALADHRLARSADTARALHDAVLFDGAHDDVALLTVAFEVSDIYRQDTRKRTGEGVPVCGVHTTPRLYVTLLEFFRCPTAPWPHWPPPCSARPSPGVPADRTVAILPRSIAKISLVPISTRSWKPALRARPFSINSCRPR